MGLRLSRLFFCAKDDTFCGEEGPVHGRRESSPYLVAFRYAESAAAPYQGLVKRGEEAVVNEEGGDAAPSKFGRRTSSVSNTHLVTMKNLLRKAG